MNELATHQFADTRSRPWTIALNVHTVEQIRDQLNLDLLEPTPELMQRLAVDPVQLVGVLAVALADDLTAADETPEGFARSLGGDAIDDATDAFLQALVNFSRRHQRPALQKALDRTRKAEEQMYQAAEKTLSSPRTDEMIDKAIDKAIGEIETELYGKPSTSSPESSELTPAP